MRGAEMLSLLLTSAFLARIVWGQLADKLGGLPTILIGSAAQAIALGLFILVDNLIGLYAVSMAFGLAFGGIIPCYPLVVRELFPVAESGWRIGVVILFGTVGMALGGWLGGLVFDLTASYRPAFLVGIAFNLFNLLCIAGLLLQKRRPPLAYAPA
jgi:MFS family permease